MTHAALPVRVAPRRQAASMPMPDAPIRLVRNRLVAIVMPRAAFIDWINGMDDEAPAIPLERARAEPNVFLLPYTWEAGTDASESEMAAFSWTGSDTSAPLWRGQHWSLLFERLLCDWDVDRTLWPERRSLGLLLSWFDVQVHSAVADCAGEPLTYHAIQTGSETQASHAI